MAGAALYPDGRVQGGQVNPDLFQGVEIVDVLDDMQAMQYVVNTVDGKRHIIAREALQRLPTEDVLAITRFQTRSRTRPMSGGRRPWPDKAAASLAEMEAGLHQLRDAERGVKARMDEFARVALPKAMTVHAYEGTDKFGLFCPCGHGGIFTEREAHFGVQRVCVKCGQRTVPNKPVDDSVHEGVLPADEEVGFRTGPGAKTFTFQAADINVGYVPNEPDYTFDTGKMQFDTYKQVLPAWRK